MAGDIPAARISTCNAAPARNQGRYVLYWMTANRRLDYNFALERAVEWARALQKPLVILEALRVGYPWASDRLHRFVVDGMAANLRRLANGRVTYYPYVERRAGEGRGLLSALGQRACVIVTDDYPAFFLPRMVRAAASQVDVLLERVDSNGLWPMRAVDKVFTRAYGFRRFLQQHLPEHLVQSPREHPLVGSPLEVLSKLPGEVTRRWPPATQQELKGGLDLATLPIDHQVGPVDYQGGADAAHRTLETFVETGLPRYVDERNEPDADATSGLSPYLHFGHISAHEVVDAVLTAENWSINALSSKTDGSRSGWWGASEAAESFLDELITWRELGFNMCAHRDDYDRYESLAGWVKQTLAEHAADEREYVYDLEQFESAATHDALWNAAQVQLVREGRIHNYLRMLWGKKILEWSATPQDALAVMVELNNKYAVDGRDPNSYSGILWCFGRYDRAWGPERPIFGKVRFMSSANTARKVRVKEYLRRYGE